MTEKRIYEGMFLFPQSASTNLQGALDHVTELLQRADAEIVSLSKWDERRLAYEIKGNKRGVYFLSYFRIDAQNLTRLERDCNLSEQLLRAMVLRAEHVPQELIEAAEGRERLADEIRLRREQPPAEGSDDESEEESDTEEDVDEDEEAVATAQRRE